jgi:hypothetical protein
MFETTLCAPKNYARCLIVAQKWWVDTAMVGDGGAKAGEPGARANGRPAETLAPIVRELQAAGITSLHGIAAALNERGIRTARGHGLWTAAPRRGLARLPRPVPHGLFRSAMLGVLHLVARLPTFAAQLAIRIEVIVALVGRDAILAVRTLLREGRRRDDGGKSGDGKELFHGRSPGCGSAIAACPSSS